MHDSATQKDTSNASQASRTRKRKEVDESDSDDDFILDDESAQPIKRLKGAAKPKIVKAKVMRATRTEHSVRFVLETFKFDNYY